MGRGTVNVCVVAGGFFVNGEDLGITALEAFDVNADNRLRALETANADGRLTELEVFDVQLLGSDTALQQQLASVESQLDASVMALQAVDSQQRDVIESLNSTVDAQRDVIESQQVQIELLHRALDGLGSLVSTLNANLTALSLDFAEVLQASTFADTTALDVPLTAGVVVAVVVAVAIAGLAVGLVLSPRKVVVHPERTALAASATPETALASATATPEAARVGDSETGQL